MKKLATYLFCLAILGGPGMAAADEASDFVTQLMDEANFALAEAGADYRVAMAEYITSGHSGAVGNTIIAKDVGNKQLAFDFVPFDLRRAGWSGPATGPDDDITYAVDTTGDAIPPLGGLGGAATDAAIDRAMATWDAENCSNLPLARNPDFGFDLGFVAFFFINGQGGPAIVADVQHAGWRDINFGGGILGVAFTLVFSPVTDIDNNGKGDTAFREIYYDPSFSWADDGVTNIDVETVALHEAGHGLSQGHFGKVFFDKKGNLKFGAEAVMNAVYVGPRRGLKGTDNGGHCSNWAQWPNN